MYLYVLGLAALFQWECKKQRYYLEKRLKINFCVVLLRKISEK